jgi:hypothetical protein
MKASELVTAVEKLRMQHGDVDIVMYDNHGLYLTNLDVSVLKLSSYSERTGDPWVNDYFCVDNTHGTEYIAIS